MTDQEPWIRQACAGDRAAFEHGVGRYYDMIFRVAYRFTGHRQDAEDITQEVVIGLVDAIHGYKGKSSFSTWLYRLVINRCHDHIRRNRTAQRSELGYHELEGLLIAEQKEQASQTAWLYRQVAALEEPFKETALLVLAEGLSHAEVASIMQCKESTVSWRMHEIRNQLKQALGNDDGR